LPLLLSYEAGAAATNEPLPSVTNAISLVALVNEALERNPELNFYRAEISAARAGRRSAGLLPNPEVAGMVGHKTAQDHASPLRIVEAVAAVNDARKRAMARKVSAALGGELRGKTVAVLGLTFKPNTDDMREAPSIPLITALQDMGAKIRTYDPIGMEQAKSIIGNVAFCKDAYACAEGASALVIVTEWEQFRALDFERLKKVMEQPILVDLRNVYRPEDVARYGFVYESIGRARQ